MPVVVEFSSGLGNQLFQYAAAYSLSRSRDHKIIGDISSYFHRQTVGGRVTCRPFALQELRFPIGYRASGWQTFYRIRGFTRLRNAVLNRGLYNYSCPEVYSAEFEGLPRNVYISGYFQDLRYFQNSLENILDVIRDQIKNACVSTWEPLPKNAGALHLRLGDYLDHPEFFPEWFSNYAPRITRQMLDNSVEHVFVFTNDPERAKRYFVPFGNRVTIVKPDFLLHGAIDLLRMASASVLAIANSSFSWWAGALATQIGNKVVAPSRWSMWCPEPSSSLYLKDWTISELGEF